MLYKPLNNVDMHQYIHFSLLEGNILKISNIEGGKPQLKFELEKPKSNQVYISWLSF